MRASQYKKYSNKEILQTWNECIKSRDGSGFRMAADLKQRPATAAAAAAATGLEKLEGDGGFSSATTCGEKDGNCEWCGLVEDGRPVMVAVI